ncbi:unnamed protein product [Schistosoma curassoni]|uniref:Uncharacterized protein n=1 Tax=Schistosoma curassoni TaxID=6186 RepID=A0A183JCQ4_9TREM|nr:unnamed protein product [Schistosoma curassoni]
MSRTSLAEAMYAWPYENIWRWRVDSPHSRPYQSIWKQILLTSEIFVRFNI